MEEFTNEVVLEFIGLYELHPVLWDPAHKGHKNRNSLNDAWEDISKSLSIEVSVSALKKKKESLMSTYRTLLKKVKDSQTTGSGTQDVYEPSWFAYAAMNRFLSASRRKIPTLSSEEYNDELIDLNSCEFEMTEQVLIEEPIENEERAFVPPLGPQRKKKTGTQGENVSNYLRHASDALQDLVNSRQSNTQDAAALYGQLWATKLRRLSKRKQIILQNKIDNLLFEAELDEMDQNVHQPVTLRSNSTPLSQSDQSPS